MVLYLGLPDMYMDKDHDGLRQMACNLKEEWVLRMEGEFRKGQVELKM